MSAGGEQGRFGTGSLFYAFVVSRFFSPVCFCITVGQGAEECRGTEAAVAGHGARPDLHFVLSGSAEVRQHGLVSVTLRKAARILAAPLLQTE